MPPWRVRRVQVVLVAGTLQFVGNRRLAKSMSGNEIRSSIALGPALIVDDELAVRERLAALLASTGVEIDAIALAQSIAEAKTILQAQPIALTLVDIGLPDGNGLELIEWLRQAVAGCNAVVITTFGTQDLIVQALRAGAVGYLLKERDDAEILASLQSIGRGGAVIDPFVAKHILHLIATVPLLPAVQSATTGEVLAEPLTRREDEILHWVAQGLISREIAEKLSRSTATVEDHVKNILRKLRVNTRTQAIYQARSLGLLQ